MATIAFIGLGRMGLGMAARLLAAGHDLQVWNRTPAKAEPLLERGARLASTPGAASRGADAALAMVADDAASRAVWTGPDGILSGGLREGALAIECSTLSHRWVLELSAVAKESGRRYVDAPVTGLPENAAAGELTLLVGADVADTDAARPLLEAFSQRIIRFGPVGAGTAYKLIINMLGAVQIASAAECMALAEKVGLDLGVVAGAIAAGQAASPQVVRNTRRMADDAHQRDIKFTPVLRLKDVRYGLELASSLGLHSPFGELAERTFAQLMELGCGDLNESKVIEVARRRSL